MYFNVSQKKKKETKCLPNKWLAPVVVMPQSCKSSALSHKSLLKASDNKCTPLSPINGFELIVRPKLNC